MTDSNNEPDHLDTETAASNGGSGDDGSTAMEARPTGDDTPLLYSDLAAPQPADSDPPPQARWLAFVSILIGGLLGGLIGYGTADLMSTSSVVVALGGIAGAALCAIGVGVVASLTLRAMNEWNVVKHPESETRASSGLVMKRDTDS